MVWISYLLEAINWLIFVGLYLIKNLELIFWSTSPPQTWARAIQYWIAQLWGHEDSLFNKT